MFDLGDIQVRAFLDTDVEDLAKYGNNRKVWLNLRDGFPHPYTLESARIFVEKAQTHWHQNVFAITTEMETIGAVSLHPGLDVHRYSAEMGYWLAEPFWGRGIMTRVVTVVSDWGLSDRSFNRVYAEPYTSNPASARVLEKAGFKLEGTMHCNVVKEGVVLDQWLYAKVKT